MLACAYSGTIVGIEAKPIVVETHRGKDYRAYSDWHGQRRKKNPSFAFDLPF